jgi:hypothetical protein
MSGQGEHDDEDIVIQLIEYMEIGKHESSHTVIGLEEATSHHTLSLLWKRPQVITPSASLCFTRLSVSLVSFIDYIVVVGTIKFY